MAGLAGHHCGLGKAPHPDRPSLIVFRAPRNLRPARRCRDGLGERSECNGSPSQSGRAIDNGPGSTNTVNPSLRRIISREAHHPGWPLPSTKPPQALFPRVHVMLSMAVRGMLAKTENKGKAVKNRRQCTQANRNRLDKLTGLGPRNTVQPLSMTAHSEFDSFNPRRWALCQTPSPILVVPRAQAAVHKKPKRFPGSIPRN